MSIAPRPPSDQPSGAGREAPASAAAERLLDLACGELAGAELQACERALAADPALAREQASLLRLRQAASSLSAVPVEAGLAQRLALRVRDQVHGEELTHRRRAAGEPEARSRWSLKARVRILLASVAVHVVVLGWLVLSGHSEPETSTGEPVEMAVTGPVVRTPCDEPPEVLAPIDVRPVVAADEISDAMLITWGLASVAGTAEPFDAVGALAATTPSATTPSLRVADHPEPVQFEMLARSRAGVRRQRLTRVGLEAGESLDSIGKGLEALAARQRDDGSFPLDLTVPADRRPVLGPVGMTALALLPFLAEGRRSAPLLGEAADPVVARGLAWLQVELRGAVGLSADDLGLGVIALSEDYMLSYGRLAPAETAARGRELRSLVERLTELQRPDGSFIGATQVAGPLWPLLALDAARHTGLALASDEAGQRLARWYGGQPKTPEGLPTDPAGRADPTLAAALVLATEPSCVVAPEADASWKATAALMGGTASLDASVGTLTSALVLYRADTRSFTRWNREATPSLRRRLGPTGAVLRGDPVADTALTLLSLQAAYRLY